MVDRLMSSTEGEPVTLVSFQIPISLKERAEAEGRRLGMNLSTFIRMAIVERLEQAPKNGA